MIFDLHIHSKYSTLDSMSEIPDIIETARNIGLNGIAVTDHDVIAGSLEALRYSPKDLLIIPGMEVSSLDGHIVALGVRQKIAPDLPAEETVDKIHDVCGIAIAAHPYDKFRHGVRDLCYELDFDAIEINGHCLMGNTKTGKIAKREGKPLTGGSDAHSLNGIGAIATEVEGNSMEEIFDNIRSGLCKPVFGRNKFKHKVSIITDKISRRYGLSRRL